MLLLVFPVLAMILMGAHLMFHGFGLLAFVVFVPIAILFVPHRFVAYFSSALLALFALEWVRAGVVLVMNRIDAGRPWMLAGAILGACAVFTLLSAAVFLSQRLRRRYGLVAKDSKGAKIENTSA